MGVKLSLNEKWASFRCPGCNETHTVSVNVGRWTWNGSLDAPTFSPSILERSGHYAKPGEPCWCTYNAENPTEPVSFRCHVCHTFVTDGKIQFLGDCTHDLAGKTVELPDW